ncbi:MAG: hypothetical protein M3144_00160, partial [Actinomycetota bacterium]|nr:hypothetical protein [Actinomycetota bacterium]
PIRPGRGRRVAQTRTEGAMTTGGVQPQPGAVPGQFVFNGLPPIPVSAPGWPTLPASQAVNFTPPATPIRLTSGVIYTVWGGATVEVGEYWSPITFETADEFYGQDAVKLSWDTGQNLARLDVDSALVLPQSEGLPVWSGGCSRQTAEDREGNELPGYYLPGGGPQYYIDSSLLAITSGPTAWEPPAPGPAPPESADGAAEPTAEDRPSRLLEAVLQLTGLVGTMADEAEERARRSDHLRRQASRLERSGRALQTEIAQLSGGGTSTPRLHVLAASLIGIGRHVQPRLSWTRSSLEAQAAVDSVVRLAYAATVEAPSGS